MANTKISALTSATTPLAGTEILPIVQSSTTKQVSIDNITAGRSVSALALSTTAGMVDVKSSSGIGVRFIETSSGNTNRVQLGTATGIGYVDVDSGVGSIQMDLKVSGATKYTIDATGNLIPAGAAKGVNFTANTPASGMTSQLLNWYEEGTWTPNQGAGLTVVGAFSSSGKYTRIGRQITIQGSVSGATSVAIAGTASQICTNLPFSSSPAYSGSMFNASVAGFGGVASSGTIVYATSTMAATTSITFSITYTV